MKIKSIMLLPKFTFDLTLHPEITMPKCMNAIESTCTNYINLD